jgi:hypothetical protein
MRVAIAWLLVALCGGWAALRLLGLERGFPLVPLVAFTPLAAAAAVVVIAVAALLRQRGATLVATPSRCCSWRRWRLERSAAPASRRAGPGRSCGC